MVTGDLFDFEKGLELGILNRIFSCRNGRPIPRPSAGICTTVYDPNKAAQAVGRIKRSVQTGAEISFEAALALERELQQQLFQSEDAKEGMDAYVGKRKAEFKGK